MSTMSYKIFFSICYVNATTLFSVVNNIVCVILCSFLLVLFIISLQLVVKLLVLIHCKSIWIVKFPQWIFGDFYYVISYNILDIF